MAITILNVRQGSDRWHAERDNFYTGSNAWKLLGAFGASEYAKATTDNFDGNFFTKRGHLLEDEAIEKIYERKHDTRVGRPGVIKNSLYPQSLYSPDGIDTNGEATTIYDIDEDGEFTILRLPKSHILIEVKCFTGHNYDDIYDHGPNLKILAQIHYGLLITGLTMARLIIYNPRYAKRQIDDRDGNLIDNPDYDPKRAYKEFPIKRDRSIEANYQRILSKEVSVA